MKRLTVALASFIACGFALVWAPGLFPLRMSARRKRMSAIPKTSRPSSEAGACPATSRTAKVTKKAD